MTSTTNSPSRENRSVAWPYSAQYAQCSQYGGSTVHSICAASEKERKEEKQPDRRLIKRFRVSRAGWPVRRNYIQYTEERSARGTNPHFISTEADELEKKKFTVQSPPEAVVGVATD